MSLYSTTIKAQNIDPSNFIDGRTCTFELDPEEVYLPNLRIAGFGYEIPTAGADHTVSELAGFIGSIKNIRLLADNVELSSLRNANRWMSFKNCLKDNQSSLAIKQRELKHSVGYVLRAKDEVDVPDIVNSDALRASNETNKALLHLDEMLPLLKAVPSLDGRVFKNLKVVIEYDKDAQHISRQGNIVPKFTEPLLIADKVVDMKTANDLQSEWLKGPIVWDEIEHDQVQVASGTATAGGLADNAESTQTTKATLNHFDNKYVSRMLIQKSPLNDSDVFVANVVQAYGTYGSYSGFKEKFNCSVDGVPLFTGNGLDKWSQRASMVDMTWGELNVLPLACRPGQGLDRMGDAPVNVSGVPTKQSATQYSQKVGSQDYIGYQVESRPKQMNITYERNLVKDEDDQGTFNRLNMPLNLHCFGEVRKTLTVGKNGYNIAYA